MSDYSVEEILKAKNIVRNNGYTVSLPKDEIEQAINIAKSAGYQIKEPVSQVEEPQMKKPVQDKPQQSVEPPTNDVSTEEKPTHPRSWEMAARYL